MKTILKIFGSSFRILLGILISGFILVGIILLIWGVPGKSHNLTNKYMTIGDFSIGEQQYYNNICHKEKGCFNGEILGLKQELNEIYLYVKINYSSGKVTYKNGSEKNYYTYNFYEFDYKNNIRIYNLIDLPKYGYLSNNELIFYSENDLQKIPQEKQEIFKELEKNQEIIIDGIEYD